jgi:hypothetical protein
MKTIKPTANKARWPRKAVKSIEARKRDLIIRIADWSREKDEPAFDVEVYIGGVYDWNESKACTFHEHGTEAKSKLAAVNFAQNQIAKLL